MSADHVAAGAAVLAFIVSCITLGVTTRQQYKYSGAMSAIAWREQVLNLHDRGLTPEQIRRIMVLEEGGEGYEQGNGNIDEILRDVPPARTHQ